MNLISINVFTNLLLTFLALIVIILIYFKRAFTYWKRKGIESARSKIPFGSTTDIFLGKTSFGEEMKRIYIEYKNRGLKYGGFYFLIRPILLVFDLELIRNILVKDFQHFTDHGNYVNEKADPLTGNLHAMKGLKWKNLRAKITPTFTSGKMKMMFQTIIDCSSELINVMDQAVERNEAIDIADTIRRFSTDVVGSCAYGIECNSLKNPQSEFTEYGKKVFKNDSIQAIKYFLSICFPQILDYFNVSFMKKDIATFFINLVNKTVEYREKNNIIRKDFIHLLIQLKNNVNIKDEDDIDSLKQDDMTDETLTMSEIAAHVFLFFGASLETSSITLTFCFYELVTNLDIQDKLRKEINDTLKKHNNKLTYEAIMEMSYMDKCINETLRKYPPSPFLKRECTKTYRFPESDLTIEKGTLLFLPIIGIQHDPKYYPNPEKFDPERFTPECKAKRHPLTWLPFGSGPRICIGLRFGLMQIKIALAILLKNYKFTLNSKTKIPLVLDRQTLMMHVDGAVWLSIEKIIS